MRSRSFAISTNQANHQLTGEPLGSMRDPPNATVNGRGLFIGWADCERALKKSRKGGLAKVPK